MSGRSSPANSRRLGRWIARALLAGLWLGVAGRLAMRVVALEADADAGFSAGGTFEVIAFGVLLGAPFALAVWFARQRWALPSWAGTAAALLLFATLVVVPPPAAQRALEETADDPRATAAGFAIVFVSYGLLLDLVWRGHRRHADLSPSPPPAVPR